MYKAISKDLVWMLKFQGTQAAAREIASRLAGSVPRLPGVVIVPVPTATSRVRQRGYDQAKSHCSRTSQDNRCALRRYPAA